MNDKKFSAESEIPNPKSQIEDLRILLWDIDGTILQSTIKGGFKEYFASALKKVYGTAGRIAEVNASGATDTQIVFKALESEGFTLEEVFAKLEEFTQTLCAEMNSYNESRTNVYEILPGVRHILENTSQNPRFLNSLLTGNLSCGAATKLSYVDAWHYFQYLPHAYGDISHDRRELGKAAEKKINEFLGFQLKPEQFIVIGDTPHDIAAARAFGARVISVGTGRGIEFDDLRNEKPDAFFEDLADFSAFLSVLEHF